MSAIIAVLIPSCVDDSDRAQVTEAVLLLGTAKAPLTGYYQNHKKWPPTLDGLLAEPSGKYVQSVAITRGAGSAGEIELTATLKKTGVDGRVAGKSVRLLSVDGGNSWTCRAGTMRASSLPASCRAAP